MRYFNKDSGADSLWTINGQPYAASGATGTNLPLSTNVQISKVRVSMIKAVMVMISGVPLGDNTVNGLYLHSSLRRANNTITLTNSNGEWVTGFDVSDINLTAVATTAYLKLHSIGAVSG